MHKRICYIVFMVVANCILANAQNLVTNGGFEDTIKCPSSQSEIWLTKGWRGAWLKNDQTTPDYFHSCCQKPYIPPDFTPAVPANSWGYQLPATGNAYAGSVIQGATSGTNLREYLNTELSSPLIKDFYYLVQFKTNLANSQFFNTSFASSNIGALFMFGDRLLSIPDKAHVNYPLIIKDTMGWTNVSGYFKADTAYTHMALGNFFTDIHTERFLLFPNRTPYISYYYYDDVSVQEFPKVNIRDTAICIGDSILLKATYSKSFAWHYKAGDSVITVTAEEFWIKPLKSATYFTTGSNNIRDSVKVDVYPPPQVNLGPDTMLCQGKEITLNAYNAGAKYTWSNGDSSSAITIKHAGLYWVRAQVGSCIDTDTIMVSYRSEDECRNFIEVYPNPFIRKIHIAGNFMEQTSVSAHLLDALGRDLGNILNTTEQNKFDIPLDLYWLRAGMYLLHVKWGQEEKLYKIIKID